MDFQAAAGCEGLKLLLMPGAAVFALHTRMALLACGPRSVESATAAAAGGAAAYLGVHWLSTKQAGTGDLNGIN